MMGSLYDKPFVNKSGETIPAYAVMQVDDTADAGGLSFYRCIKPAEGGKVYLVNGPRSVANDTRSMAASALAHLGLYALVEGATPTKNEEWGPKSGSWKLNKGDGYKGFFIVGGAQAGRVRVSGVSGTSTEENNGDPGTVDIEAGFAIDSDQTPDGIVAVDRRSPTQYEAGKVQLAGHNEQNVFRWYTGIQCNISPQGTGETQP